MAAVGKTVEELDLQLEAVTKDVWVLRSIALTWLVGGGVLGILPLGSRSRRTVGITWLVLASWRYIIHSIRNSEPFSTWVLTVFMPSTLLPGILGCLVATTGGGLAGRAKPKVAHELENAESQLQLRRLLRHARAGLEMGQGV